MIKIWSRCRVPNRSNWVIVNTTNEGLSKQPTDVGNRRAAVRVLVLENKNASTAIADGLGLL